MPATRRPDSRQLSCSTITFRHLSLGEALQAIKDCGVPDVELAAIPHFAPHFEPFAFSAAQEEDFVRTVQASGLRPRSFNSGGTDFNDPDADVEAMLTAARRVLAVGARLGVEAVGIRGGGAIDRGVDSLDEHIARMAGPIRMLSGEAADLGLRLRVEAPHSGGLILDAHEAMRLLEAVGHPNTYVIFDSAHHFRSGLSFRRAVRILGARIDQVHLRDHDGQENVYPLGAGKVDFGQLLAALDEIAYAGTLCLEMPEAGTSAELAIRTVRQSVEFLSRLEG